MRVCRVDTRARAGLPLRGPVPPGPTRAATISPSDPGCHLGRSPACFFDCSWFLACELEVRAVRPWLVAVLGLGIALAAIYALVTGVFVGGTRGQGEDIDESSRAGLRELLQDSGGER